MRKEPYSLCVDASNDSGLSKMNSLIVRIFNVNKSTVSQKFLDIFLTSGVDAAKSSENFQKINGVLRQCDVSWENCMSFGVDNTNSNIDAVNSIRSRVIRLIPVSTSWGAHAISFTMLPRKVLMHLDMCPTLMWKIAVSTIITGVGAKGA